MLRRCCLAAALVVVSVPSLLASCAGETTSPPSTVSPEGGASLPPVVDGGAGETDSPAKAITASDYCESIADFFCEFYLRCDRMVAADTTECRAVFIETCNARYEPRYVDLERAKLLTLSRAGVDACAAHLAKVACTEQASDLDGPCSAMWTGSASAGAKCAIDVESFVCAPGTTCIIGVDFCGNCETAAPRGGACEPGVKRCTSDDACVEGKCIARALPGQPCSDTKPCVVGSACTAGTCVAPAIVGEGETCDSKHRCAYRSYCEAGTCVRASLLGEACASSRACVSGRCEAGNCVPLLETGEACTASSECSSARCSSGKCTSLPSSCLDP